jgi:acyl carrier protein
MAADSEELLERVQRVLREVFADEHLVINEDTHLSDIPEWDSTSHVTLIMALENEFNVRLNARQASEAVAIPPILDVLRKKMSANRPPS